MMWNVILKRFRESKSAGFGQEMDKGIYIYIYKGILLFLCDFLNIFIKKTSSLIFE